MDTEKIEKLMQKCHNVSSINMAFKDGHLLVNSTYIKPASYVSFRDLSLQYMNVKKDLMRKIFDIQALVISNIKPSKDIQHEYETYVKELADIEDKLNELNINYASANRNERYYEILNEIQQLKDKERRILDTESEYDKKVSKKLANINSKLLSLNTELKHVSDASTQEYLKIKDAKIVKKVEKAPSPARASPSPPKAKGKATTKGKPKTEVKTKTKKEKGPSPKTKLNLTKEEKNTIKTNVKDLIRSTFAFKNSEECLSKKRSQPYYETKDSIVEKISKSAELKKLMPGNYRSLTKEKICDKLFDS